VPGQSYPVTFTGGGTSPNIVQAVAHAIADESGAINTANLVIDSYGAWYEQAPNATMDAPPAGTGHTQCTLTATMVAGANPICAVADAVLNQLVGHAIFESAGTSQIDDDNWRETLSSQRIIGLSGGVKVLDPVSGLIIARPLAPRVVGALIKRDHQTGAPFHSAANQPINGIIGPLRQIGFSLVDGDNEGQVLLSHNIGILIRGEVGVETAIASGGFVFVGTDNLGEDELWRFYNVMRGRDYIHLSLIRAIRIFLGRENITGHTIQAVLNTIEFFLRDLQADDHILGHKISFSGSQNSAEQIRLGHLTVGFAAEEPPVLRKITVQSARYRPAIDAMIAQLAAQLNIPA
jgi:phage tail sheath protein FI